MPGTSGGRGMCCPGVAKSISMFPYWIRSARQGLATRCALRSGAFLSSDGDHVEMNC